MIGSGGDISLVSIGPALVAAAGANKPFAGGSELCLQTFPSPASNGPANAVRAAAMTTRGLWTLGSIPDLISDWHSSNKANEGPQSLDGNVDELARSSEMPGNCSTFSIRRSNNTSYS